VVAVAELAELAAAAAAVAVVLAVRSVVAARHGVSAAFAKPRAPRRLPSTSKPIQVAGFDRRPGHFLFVPQRFARLASDDRVCFQKPINRLVALSPA